MNDQGGALVDTALANSAELAVTEVVGGCFCCRFPDLVTSLRRLQATVAPDVILAEPVGSCADLIATVLRPLTHYYGDQYTLAPFSVLAAADRNPASLSPRARYLVDRQLEEAELLLVSKADRLDPAALAQQVDALAAAHPGIPAFPISAATGAGLDTWLDRVLTVESQSRLNLEIDYQTYAEAEAELAWCNVQGSLSAPQPFVPAAWADALLRELAAELQAEQMAAAHVKLYLDAGRTRVKASLTDTNGPIQWDLHPADARTAGIQFVLNARVAAAPKEFERLVRRRLGRTAAAEITPRCDITHFECFAPAPPNPPHRMQAEG
jgi:G3E family GTPase